MLKLNIAAITITRGFGGLNRARGGGGGLVIYHSLDIYGFGISYSSPYALTPKTLHPKLPKT